MTPEQENQLFRSMGSIEAKLDRLGNEIDRRFGEINNRVSATESAQQHHANELSNLKVKVAVYGGAAGVITMLVAELVKGAMK